MGKAKREAKRLIEQLRKVDKEIAESEKAIKDLQTAKANFMADVLTESTRSVALSDILTDDQIKVVVEILNRPNVDDIAMTKLLKEYLRTIGPQLEAKGVVADYLAYMIIHMADQLRQAYRNMWN